MVEVRLGEPLQHSGIREGDHVYFQCRLFAVFCLLLFLLLLFFFAAFHLLFAVFCCCLGEPCLLSVYVLLFFVVIKGDHVYFQCMCFAGCCLFLLFFF